MTFANVLQKCMGILSLKAIVICYHEHMVQIVFCDLWHESQKQATTISIQFFVIQLRGMSNLNGMNIVHTLRILPYICNIITFYV